jgi:4-amino-4-deoxy-L-arabinose transferase-like glycosyltransferase
LLLAALPTAALAALIFLWLEVVTPAVLPRLVVALGYGLATPAFAYANAFYGHQLSAFLLFAAFYLLARAPTRIGVGRALGVGLLLGYAFVTEYPVALMIVPLGLYALYAFWQRRQLAPIFWLATGGLVVAAGWMWYNVTIFGGPLELGYSRSELWADQHHTGFMSLTTPTLDAVWGITFSPFRGLFLLAPWLLLALPGFVLWWRAGRQRAEWWLALSYHGGDFSVQRGVEHVVGRLRYRAALSATDAAFPGAADWLCAGRVGRTAVAAHRHCGSSLFWSLVSPSGA